MPTHTISVDGNPANSSTGDATARPYKSYVALITQVDNETPVATVLENTLGVDVVWSRLTIGRYEANFSANAAGVGVCVPFGSEDNLTLVSTYDGATLNGYYAISSQQDRILLNTFDLAMADAELSSLVYSSSLLVNYVLYPTQ